jgi:uncharacterized damage-inducible protein DinB
MKQKPWIDRQFPLDTPVSLFPGLIERLRGTPARLEERIASLPADLRVRRSGSSWSIQENAGHLLDLEPLWDGRLDDFEAGLASLRPADMTNRATREADHNARPIAGILEGFRTLRGRLVARCEALDSASIERLALHPRLGKPMRVIDMVLFVTEHDDHHLARISELLRGGV